MANSPLRNWGWRKELNQREIVGRLGGGCGFLRVKDLFDHIFSEEEEAMQVLVQYNTIELVVRLSECTSRGIPNDSTDTTCAASKRVAACRKRRATSGQPSCSPSIPPEGR